VQGCHHFILNLDLEMFAQFYILSPRGDSIIFRNFRTDINKSTAEIFFRHARFWQGKAQEAPPVFNIDGIHYMWLKKAGLYFVLCSLENVSPCMAMELLIRTTKLLKDFCGVLNEESVRANFTLIYEVIDEVFDWGYPQSTTNSESMRMYIYNEPVEVTESESKLRLPHFSGKTMPSSAVDKPIHTRDRESKNRIFVDVYERISMTFNSSGTLLNKGIDGTIQLKSYLGSKPELHMALNENLVIGRASGARANVSTYGVVELEDCNFHECVRDNDFEQHKILTMNAPDGEFVVMNYRVGSEFRPPFRIFPFFELTSSHKCELAIKLRCEIPATHHSSAVFVQIPMPKSASSVSLRVPPSQSAEYDERERVVKWRIGRMQGNTESMIRCSIALSSAQTASVRKDIGPIAVQFEIPFFNTSNLQVKYLRVLDPTTHREIPDTKVWVRYITRSNAYVCRL